jgi:hypothetical protein
VNYRDTKDCITASIAELQAEMRLHDPNSFEAWELSEKIHDFIKQIEDLDHLGTHNGVTGSTESYAVKPRRHIPRVLIYLVAGLYLALAVFGALIR